MRTLFIAIMTALAVVTAFACNDSNGGSGGSLTLEEYFDELDRISRAAEERSDSALPPDLDADASFEESRDAFAAFFEEIAEDTTDSIEEISNLNPPDEVEEEHDAFEEALGELPDFFDEYGDRIANADSDEELGEVITDETGDDIIERVDAACRDLQAVADDNNIDIDLDCDDEDD